MNSPWVLALEQSTVMQSVALLEGGRVVAVRNWQAATARSQQVFAILPALCAEAGLTLAEVDLFAVGVGPGSFSGIRTAVAAVRAMALPADRQVAGIGSAEALAVQVAGGAAVERVVVFGDARRQRVWLGEYRVTDGGADGAPPRLVTAADAAGIIAAADLAVSPDRQRLAAWLESCGIRFRNLAAEPVYPEAASVGRIACARLLRGAIFPPPAPIYLHPAVFVDPRCAPSGGSVDGT